MCLFISVWLPKGTDSHKLEPVYKKHGKDFKGPNRRLYVPELEMVFEEYDPGPSRHCDCDSSLGWWGVNLFEKNGYPFKYMMKLSWRRFKARMRGEDVEKVTMESVMGRPEPSERDYKSIDEENDLQLWMDIISESVGSGYIEGFGLSLAWADYEDMESIECLTMEDVTLDSLLRMRLDTLYVFSEKKPPIPKNRSVQAARE